MLQVISITYDHGTKKAKTVNYSVDPNFFRYMMSLSATPTGGSAYNTLMYQLAEAMVHEDSGFAWADKPGLIQGFGVAANRDAIIQLMLQSASTVGQMDESEVEEMKQAFGMSDQEKDRLRVLGGIN